MPVAISDLMKGTMLRLVRGKHPEVLMEVRQIKTNRIEMRMPHNQRKSTSNMRPGKFDMPIDLVLTQAEIVKQPNVKLSRVGVTTDEFVEMWNDTRLSVPEIAILSDTTEDVVVRTAKGLGLRRDRNAG